MCGSYNAFTDDSTLYVTVTPRVFCYTISTSSWSQLPGSPTYSCTLVVIKNLLTLVGGRRYDIQASITNQLFSLTGEGSGRRWTEEFPPMPTKRSGTIVLCTKAAPIVAGGENNESVLHYVSGLKEVEVMNTETLQWSTAAALSQPLQYAPASVCGDQIYILGGSNMYTCSLQALLQSCKLPVSGTEVLKYGRKLLHHQLQTQLVYPFMVGR